MATPFNEPTGLELSPTSQRKQEFAPVTEAGGESRDRRRVLAVAWILGALAVLWVVRVEYLYQSIEIGNAVPPIPSLAALLFVAAIGALLRRKAQQDCWHTSALRTYLLITVAATIPSAASLTFVFAQITAAQYAASAPGMAPVAANLPSWYAPPVGKAIRLFYEGSFQGGVPWRIWAMPLLGWGVFLFTLLLTLYSLLALLRRSWMEEERLAYPIVQIPIRLLGGDGNPSLLRSPLFWIGFGLTAFYDGVNMFHAFSPAFPSLGTGFDIGEYFVNKPWNALSPMFVSYRPEILGIGYLMPTDVLFTVWVSYVALRLSTVFRFALGEPIAGTAYDYQELGMGAFLCLFALLLKRAIPDLKRSLSEACRRHGPVVDRREPLSSRAAWAILVAGPVAMLFWLKMAGLPVWIGSLHLFLLAAVAIVYARMRAETGTPMIYLFPFWQQQSLLFNFLGSQPLAGVGGQPLTILASLGGLSRGYYPEVCAYGAEGMSLAERARFPQRHVTLAFLGGTALGLVLGGYLYLNLCYRYGASQLGGNYQLSLMRQQFAQVVQTLQTPTLPKHDLMFQTFLGGFIAIALNWMRQSLISFPLHPMGFAMASAYGYHLWAPFLVVWFCKTLILRWGGNAGYRRMLPLFLGIALGRYLFTGIVWGLLGLTGNPAVQSYHVHFS